MSLQKIFNTSQKEKHYSFDLIKQFGWFVRSLCSRIHALVSFDKSKNIPINVSFLYILFYFQKITININVLFLIFCLLVHSGYSQTLQEYKQEAQQNNPGLKAAQKQYQATLERVKELGGLPNTTIGAGYFVSEPETRTGAQKARFSAQQQFPWFGTLKSREKIVTAASEIDKNTIEIQKRKVFLQLETNYYELYGLKAKIRILKEQYELLKTYEEIALIEVQNNRATAVDVLKLNVAKNNLQNTIEILKGEVLTKESALNQVLHRDGFDPLEVPDNLYIPDEEPTLMIDDITYHPELENFEFMDAVVEQRKRSNAKEALPSFALGLDYVVVEERPEMVFSDNGKDIIMPMVSLSIPLFTSKYASRNLQYDLEKEALEQRREAAQNDLENMLESAVNKRITSRINFDTQQKNIAQAKEAEKLLRTQYETALINFDELLEVQQMILDFEYKKIEAIAMYFKQTAILNYLM